MYRLSMRRLRPSRGAHGDHKQMTENEIKFEQWAIVDVMGHQRFVGLVTEEVIAGQGFIRVDIPKTDKNHAWSKLIGPSSIYAITPVEKNIAMAMANNLGKRAIEPYQLTQTEIAGATVHALPFGEDDDEENWHR